MTDQLVVTFCTNVAKMSVFFFGHISVITDKSKVTSFSCSPISVQGFAILLPKILSGDLTVVVSETKSDCGRMVPVNWWITKKTVFLITSLAWAESKIDTRHSLITQYFMTQWIVDQWVFAHYQSWIWLVTK